MTTPRRMICGPEQNGSIPPCHTNAIVWLSVQGDDFRQLFNARLVAMITNSGGGGIELMVSLRIELTHPGAQVVGRQIFSNYAIPQQDGSITDLLQACCRWPRSSSEPNTHPDHPVLCHGPGRPFEHAIPAVPSRR